MGRNLVLAILLSVFGGSFVAACTDPSGASGPDLVSVGFGTGGSDCDLTGVASSFAVGVSVRTVVTFSPDLPAGGTVTVTVEKDGAELVDFRDTLTLEEPAACLLGTLPGLEVGHYRVQYQISPSAMPPASGEFDVTT